MDEIQNESPVTNIGDLIDKFVEKNPGTHWYEDFNEEHEDNIDDSNLDIHQPE
jgi:hypothetical protein